MYGLIFENFAGYLKHKYGEDAWDQIRRLANIDSPSFSVHHVRTLTDAIGRKMSGVHLSGVSRATDGANLQKGLPVPGLQGLRVLRGHGVPLRQLPRPVRLRRRPGAPRQTAQGLPQRFGQPPRVPQVLLPEVLEFTHTVVNAILLDYVRFVLTARRKHSVTMCPEIRHLWEGAKCVVDTRIYCNNSVCQRCLLWAAPATLFTTCQDYISFCQQFSLRYEPLKISRISC